MTATAMSSSSAVRPPRCPMPRAPMPTGGRAPRPHERDLFPPPPLLTQAHLLGELRTRRGVVRRDHRIVGRQIPFLAVGLRRHAVLRAQVALERFELLAVFEADDVVGRDRALDRHCGLGRLRRRLAVAARHPRERRVHLADQRRQVAGRDAVVADIGRDDLGGQRDVVATRRAFAHRPFSRSLCAGLTPGRGKIRPLRLLPEPRIEFSNYCRKYYRNLARARTAAAPSNQDGVRLAVFALHSKNSLLQIIPAREGWRAFNFWYADP